MQISWKWGISILDGQKIREEALTDMAEKVTLSLGENSFCFTRKELVEAAFRETACCILAEKADIPQGRIQLIAELPEYREDWFIFMPSACYDGNRFKMLTKRKPYASAPNYLVDYIPRDLMDPEVVLKEVPSLFNTFNRKITDASAPLIGIFMPEKKESFFLALEQDTLLGDNGVELRITEENSLQIILSLPCVRRRTYLTSERIDTAPALKSGLEVKLSFQTREMAAADITAFYEAFAQIRGAFPRQGAFRHYRSLSHALEILLKMFEEVRFLKEYGFYTKARGQKRLELGWVSGQEYSALFANGSQAVKEQVMTQLHNIFDHAPLANGFFLQLAEVKEGEDTPTWRALGYPVKDPLNTTLVRMECEMLFFLTKLLQLLDAENVTYPDSWKTILRDLAEAFYKLYLTYGQFGNILDLTTGKLLVGGSGNGMLGPGAMAVASEYFGEPRYLEAARVTARNYCKDLRRKGFTCGGPGDAISVPDSESAFSLLESMVTLAELDKEYKEEFTREAEFVADYCSSWVPAIAYKFPKGSTFDKLGIDCRGSVQANLQNQHGAPAACINSSSAYFRLYRMTGKVRYLELLREIVHNCVQYISTDNTPIPAVISKSELPLPCGDICEKVYFQDYWMPGEIYRASGGWPEIAVLLTITENPGIYCVPEKEFCFVMDHVDAQLQGNTLTVSNPFDYPITVNLFTEKEEDQKKPFGFWPFRKFRKLQLAGKETRDFDLAAL